MLAVEATGCGVTRHGRVTAKGRGVTTKRRMSTPARATGAVVPSTPAVSVTPTSPAAATAVPSAMVPDPGTTAPPAIVVRAVVPASADPDRTAVVRIAAIRRVVVVVVTG